MSSATLPQASAGAALLGRAVLVPLDDASRPVLRHRTFPARFCLYIENARAAVSFPARCVLQRMCCRNITAAGLKVGTVRVVAPLLAVAAAAAVLTTAPPANPARA